MAVSLRATAQVRGPSEQSSVLPSPAERRYEYVVSDLLVEVEHPSGGVSHRRVHGRYISAREIVVEDRAYVHTGSRVRLTLSTIETRERMKVQGTVKACTYCENGTHQVVIGFDQPVHPRFFVASAANVRLGDDDSSVQDLVGSLLLVDPEVAVCRLLAHHLRDTLVDLVAATSLDEAKALLRAKSFDLVACDLRIAAEGVDQLVAGIRMSGYQGAIMGLYGVHDPGLVRRAEERGIASFLQKPYVERELFQVLGRHLTASAVGSQAMRSEFADRPEMRPLLSWYSGRVQTLGNELAKALREGNTGTLRECVMTLNETAAGYGYPQMHEASTRALQAIDGGAGEVDVESAIQALTLLIRRVR